MAGQRYETLTGRRLDLERLDKAEVDFLAAVRREVETDPEWSRFAAWWSDRFREARLPAGSAVYRVCQDLEARLGIAQGRVAWPDYRDCLADLIEERFGSRDRFCEQAGLDPEHLSRALASRAELSLRSMRRILDALRAAPAIRPEEEVTRQSDGGPFRPPP
ncbi:MAG: hypothetical protein PVG07_14355 [Acidobacteriota bacterium]|jgi:hypothetical protein